MRANRPVPRLPPRGARGCPGRGADTGHSPKAIRGVSLVDLTVGILLLEVGVLALVATAGGVVRLTLLGGREGAASLVAASRLEELRATACATTAGPPGTGGDARSGPFEERWTIISAGSGRTVQVLVSYADGQGTRAALYETAVECAP